jgi:Uma2 family endonuclease
MSTAVQTDLLRQPDLDFTPSSMPLGDAPATQIPLLHSGDHLTADEFERRYEAMPGVRAELIEGVVYVASPVSADHGEPHMGAIFWLAAYRTETPQVTGGVDTTIRLDLQNRPQPDGHLRVLPEYGGRAKISSDRYIIGAPELVIEIALSSVSYDLHDKLNAYRRNDVREYVVWRVEDGAIDWFVLRDGVYERLALNPEGQYRSSVLPGLWLDPAALISSNYSAVLRIVQRGLASPEHDAFVDELQATAARLAEAPAQEPLP